MSEKAQGTLAIVLALLVLLSAMWEPVVSLSVAITALLLIGFYQLTGHSGRF